LCGNLRDCRLALELGCRKGNNEVVGAWYFAEYVLFFGGFDLLSVIHYSFF
jgi:hypothetical protein